MYLNNFKFRKQRMRQEIFQGDIRIWQVYLCSTPFRD